LSAHQLGGARPLRDIDLEKLHAARARYKLNASRGPSCR
jgi:hypothetical protein